MARWGPGEDFLPSFLVFFVWFSFQKKRTALSHASQAISGGGSAWIWETWGLENDTVCPCFEMFDSLVVILLMVQGCPRHLTSWSFSAEQSFLKLISQTAANFFDTVSARELRYK